MSAFVALMGRRFIVSVLVDGPKSSAILDRIRRAAEDNGVPKSRIVAITQVDDALPTTADIEDLFAPTDYLKLYNWAFNKTVQLEDLADTSVPIIKKLQDLHGREFDHALPAHALTEHQAEFFSALDQLSVDRFTALFELLNGAMS